MPKTRKQFDGLTDSWGRRNRTLADRQCEACGKAYRPRRVGARFCSRPCLWTKNGGQNRKPIMWWKNAKGYVDGRMWTADGRSRRVKQHRLIAEVVILGRPLLPTEDVHHKDGNKANNCPSNLEVIDHSEHSRHTNKGRTYKRGHKLNLTPAERKRRSEWMRSVHARKRSA